MNGVPNRNNNDNAFIEITNHDIYRELQEIKTQGQAIIQRQDITNGKVKLNRWIATTALSLVVAILLHLVLK